MDTSCRRYCLQDVVVSHPCALCCSVVLQLYVDMSCISPGARQCHLHRALPLRLRCSDHSPIVLRLAALVSRQYVDMSRIRIEGLLAAFPKLVGSGKQHTYVETENVRYVYQPMEVRWGCLAYSAKNHQLLFRQHNPRR